MLRSIFLIYVIVVLYFSLSPSPIGAEILHSDKLSHFIAYFVMGFLVYITFRAFRQKVYMFVLIILLGVLIEGAQHYIPGRTASYTDIVANTLGLLISYFVCWLAASRITKMKKLNTFTPDADQSDIIIGD